MVQKSPTVLSLPRTPSNTTLHPGLGKPSSSVAYAAPPAALGCTVAPQQCACSVSAGTGQVLLKPQHRSPKDQPLLGHTLSHTCSGLPLPLASCLSVILQSAAQTGPGHTLVVSRDCPGACPPRLGRTLVILRCLPRGGLEQGGTEWTNGPGRQCSLPAEDSDPAEPVEEPPCGELSYLC